jgi:cytochrome P450
VRLVPPRVVPPARQLTGAAFIAAFVRNPLSVVPQAAYEEDFVRARARGGRFAWITAPDLIRTVLLDERDKFGKRSQIRLLSPLLGRGILTSEGAEWRWQRQASSPVFRPAESMRFVPEFVAAAERALARWRAAPAGSTQAVDRDMTRATFEVISATLLPSARGTVAPVLERSLGVFQRSGGWEQLFASLSLPRWIPRPGIFSGARAVIALRGAVAALLAERRALAAPPDDLMQRLIAARDPETGQAMNDAQLVDNLLTFYLAGHETTAKALTWTLYLLARSPEWSEALAAEAERVTGGAPLAAGHLEHLVLTQQVLKESMRLYPPVPIVTRQAVAEARLGAHAIAPGAVVLMPIYAIHRHARRWEDPDAFVPERFAPGREAAIPRYQYLPFGAGPRICIGREFALIEATAMLATLARGARFAPLEGCEPAPVARVTLLPRGGMPLRVQPR